MMFSKNFMQCIVYFLVYLPAYNVQDKMRIFGFFLLVFIILRVPEFISWVLSVIQLSVRHVENHFLLRKLTRKKGPKMTRARKRKVKFPVAEPREGNQLEPEHEGEITHSIQNPAKKEVNDEEQTSSDNTQSNSRQQNTKERKRKVRFSVPEPQEENPPSEQEAGDEEKTPFDINSSQPNCTELQSTTTVDHQAIPNGKVADTPTDSTDQPTKRMRKRRRKKNTPADPNTDEVVTQDTVDGAGVENLLEEPDIQEERARELRAECAMQAIKGVELCSKAIAKLRINTNRLERTVSADSRSGTMTSRADSRLLAKNKKALIASRAADSRLKRKKEQFIQKANSFMFGSLSFCPFDLELFAIVAAAMPNIPEEAYPKLAENDLEKERKFERCVCYRRFKNLVHHGKGEVSKLRTQIMLDESYFGNNKTHNPNTGNKIPRIMMPSEIASFMQTFTLNDSTFDSSAEMPGPSESSCAPGKSKESASVSAKPSLVRTSDYVMERMNRDSYSNLSVIPNSKSWTPSLVNLSSMTYICVMLYFNNNDATRRQSAVTDIETAPLSDKELLTNKNNGRVGLNVPESKSSIPVTISFERVKSNSAIRATVTIREETTSSPESSPCKKSIDQESEKSIKEAFQSVPDPGLTELKKTSPTSLARVVTPQPTALSTVGKTSPDEDASISSSQKEEEEEASESVPKTLKTVESKSDTMSLIKTQLTDREVIRPTVNKCEEHTERSSHDIEESNKKPILDTESKPSMSSGKKTITYSKNTRCNKSVKETPQDVSVSPESSVCTVEAETSFSDPPTEVPYVYVPCELHPLSPYTHKRPIEQREFMTGCILRLMKRRTHFFAKISTSHLDVCNVCKQALTKDNLGFPIGCIACHARVHLDCHDDLFDLCTPAPTLSLEDQKRERFAVHEYVNPEYKPEIPSIIVQITFLIMFGESYTVKHLYRNPETDTKLDAFKKLLQQGWRPNLLILEPLLMGEVLKDFLGSLKPRLITQDLFRNLKTCLRGTSKGPVNVDIFRKTFAEVSDNATRETLIFIFMHLQDVSNMKDVEMPVTALARAFSPVLIDGFQREQSLSYYGVIEQILRLPRLVWQCLFSDFVEGLDV